MINLKRLFSAFFAACALTHSAAASSDSDLNKSNCTFKGFPLYGDVQVVTSFPDIKVQIVESFADIHVQTVTSFADDCGLWKFVTSFPDVKIQ